MKNRACFLLLICSFLLSACANYRINYSAEAEGWNTQLPPAEEQPTYTVYLIGDAGTVTDGEISPALQLLREKLKDAGENNAVLFLGGNVSRGMAPKSKKEKRAAAEYSLKAQLDAVADFPGRILFIPGEEDWAQWGLKGIERQADFVEDYLGRKDVWFPKAGCGDPEVVELTDNLVALLIDSQWYLQDWDGIPEINGDCEIKSRDLFELEVGEAFKGNRSKNILVAMHHPPYTYGPHGGRYPAKDHLFPLTLLNKNLWIPLPGVGSVFNFLRANISREQSLSNPDYRKLRNSLIGLARRNGNFIFASGHEHSLQYIERRSQAFIVSGAGSQRTPVRNGEGADFSYGQYGWAKVDYYADGSSWVEYWVAEGDGSDGKLVFRKKATGPLADLEAPDTTQFEPVKPGTTVTVPVSEDDFDRGPLWTFLFGKHYRDVYAAEVELPILDLSSFQGGVVPVRRGGGFQTNSLRLESASGRQFTMRSIDKDATRTLPYPFNRTFVVDIVRDNFSASHPFAAVAIPPLADAVNVYHTNPRIYYVPRQPGLGAYNEDFGDALYLVEERPDDEFWEDAPYFGNPEEILSTSNVVEEIQEEQDDQIDQAWVVRSRLFDMAIGDWDRHDDQWRWSLIDTGKVEYYRPIPRDRDQAFCKYDGFLVAIIRNATGISKQFRPYTGDLKPVKWGNYNARHVDPTFTSAMEWADWEREAKYIQSHLTDAVIDSAFKANWPEKIYELSAPEIITSLKGRRDNIVDIARRYYLFRSRVVHVAGTEKRELFEVERLEGGRVKVRVYDTNKDLDKQMLIYERTFLSSETKEINLFGLGNDDTFIISGKTTEGPKVRLIGGLGDDTFIDESSVRGAGKKNEVYDVESEKNKVEAGPETRVRIGSDPLYNSYNRKAKDREYNFGNLFPFINFNPDDGVLVGVRGSYTTYGFRKDPFASRHTYGINYAIATRGVQLSYEGQFNQVLRSNWDLLLQANAQTDLYSINFYGLGNDTPNPELSEDQDEDYNRVRQGLFDFKPMLFRFTPTGGWGFGPTYEFNEIERTAGRFIDEVADQLNPEVFDGVQYLGLRLSYEYTNLNHPIRPSQGISFRTEGGWKYNLNDPDRNFPYVDAALSVYQRFDREDIVVFAVQAGFQHRFNNNFEFFQAANLGGTGRGANFRGTRRNRYSGKTAFYQNNDLRLKVIESGNNTLPFDMGILLGFDHGRVWLEEGQESSDTWHYSYGGGIWISPISSLILNVSFFRPDDQRNTFTVQGAYFF